MDNKLFNFRDYCFGIPGIEKFSQVQAPNMIPEAWSTQAAVLSLWQREKHWLRERILMPRERLLEWKIPRIAELVDYAYTHIPFYHSLYESVGYTHGGIRTWSDFQALPMISKLDMIKNFPEFVLPHGLDRKNCRLIRSSGSSGRPVSVIVDRWREDIDTVNRMRTFEHLGGFHLDPKDWTYNIHHALWTYTSFLGQYPIFTISQDCPPMDAAEHLTRLRPAIISSLTSYLPKLAETGIDLKQIGVKVVSSNSETSSLQERQRLENVFKVPVLDEYSSEELGLLAMECKHHHYHAIEDDSHIEIINPDSTGLGDVVGTDLWNYAMPFIRYQIGDLAAWDSVNTNCPCGSGFQIMRTVSGRADQAFISEGRGKIAPGSLMDACDQFLVPRDSGLQEFRLIQHKLRQLELVTVPFQKEGKICANAYDGFRKRINDLFGYDVQILITYVDQIPSEASYKRRMIINKLKQE
ncbi:MAG: phenylacetate--CoA ligase family protein [Bdellovibrio sp.]|nr:phenylacetate--CoA ligase family protein [Bdellovibrio sp.]